MLEALPAVTVPSALKAARRPRILASSNLFRPSSSLTVVVLPLTVIETGAISSTKTLSATALRARAWLSTAKSSCCCRVKPYLLAHWSAKHAHRLVAVRVGQSVVHQGVHHLAVAHADSPRGP